MRISTDINSANVNLPTRSQVHGMSRDRFTRHVAADELAAGLQSVVAGDVLAARCPAYYAASLAQQMSERLVQHPDFGRYEKAPDIGKVGFPYYDTVGDDAHEARYWAEARSRIATVRAAFAPYTSPIDRVRLQLDEQWPHGARLLRAADGRPAFAGLARVFEGQAQALPHVDRLEWDAPQGRFVEMPTAQVAMNVYLQMPQGGGQLAIWRMKPDQLAYERLRLPGSYGLQRDRLPNPDVVIEPQPGELILFDAQNVHAVWASSGGRRVTVSFFVVLDGEGQALVYS